MRSTFDTCIFYNAIIKDGRPYNDGSLEYMKKYITEGLQSVVESYYFRSERLINKIRELGIDNEETWSQIHRTYVADIVNLIRDEVYLEVYPKTFEMIEKLEQQYGVE